jgi:hypothetical protein
MTFDAATEKSFKAVFQDEALKYSRECGDRFRSSDKTIAGIKFVENSPISKALKEGCSLAIGQGQSMIHIDENLKLTVLDKSKIFNGE